MFLPRIFDNNYMDRFFDDHFFDDRFSFPFRFASPASQWMNTNVQDLGDKYQFEIDLPGYDKKDIHAQLKNGYLIISARKEESKEKKDKKGKYIHRERYSGSCQRSFYVGDQRKEEDFKASFDNGVLKIVFPKLDQRSNFDNSRYIDIE